RGILRGEEGPRRDIVLLNSAAALYVSGAVDSIAKGMRLAAESIDSGKAQGKLDRLIELTNAS
ncbi:MAG: anthranilate phosphoribosyltransferase, partial [Candidatus Binatia bacterium]